jgi:hypothetical protein
MFIKFSEDKTRYEKGQIFVFLIAVIAILLIIAMITVNLGQLSLFKTDVSNAADAGALAGASILSSTLLGFGLASDTMAGTALVTGFLIICFVIVGSILIATGIGAPIGAYLITTAGIMYTNYMINYWANYAGNMLGGGILAHKNAKQTAIQYAFNNVGIDEPRPTFEQFLRNVYDITDPDKQCTAEQIEDYYHKYMSGEGDTTEETKKILKYSRSGFTRFMEDNKEGYWNKNAFGSIDPSRYTPETVTSGYGWWVASDGVIENSYCNRQGKPYNDATKYRQSRDVTDYIEVKVHGSTSYPVTWDSLITEGFQAISDFLLGFLPDGLAWILGGIMGTIRRIFGAFFPTHFTMGDGTADDMIKWSTGNYITVTVTRYKKKNLGLWSFLYGRGGRVSAKARAHAYTNLNLYPPQTIEQVLLSSPTDVLVYLKNHWDWRDMGKLRRLLKEAIGGLGNALTWRHLFETKLAPPQ